MSFTKAVTIASLAAAELFVDFAQPTSVGAEFPVNTYTTGSQRFPSVCTSGEGDFVVVWEDGRADSSRLDHSVDGSETAVIARVLGGEPPHGEAEFLVNTYATGRQGQPSVACLDDGGFVVVWSEAAQYFAPNDGRFGVVGRRYDAGGTPGDEFPVDMEAPALGDPPDQGSVCRGPDGGFVVVWNVANDTVVRRYDAQGAPAGTDVHVPRVIDPKCCGSAEGFVVVGSSYSVVIAQRFSDTAGPQFLVSTNSPQSTPAVACNSAGKFVVVWEHGTQYGYDVDVNGQLFAADGAKLNEEFRVHATELDNRREKQVRPGVAMDGAGRFVVVWRERGNILWGEFDSSANRLGATFQANAHTTEISDNSSVAADVNGEVVITWHTGDQDHNIFGLRYALTGPVCGDPVAFHASLPGESSPSNAVTATDALITLRTAVGSEACQACVCDVDQSGSVSATDALIVLKYALGEDVTLQCVPC